MRPEEVAYIGDDLIDWPVMAEVGLSVAVADAASAAATAGELCHAN